MLPRSRRDPTGGRIRYDKFKHFAVRRVKGRGSKRRSEGMPVSEQYITEMQSRIRRKVCAGMGRPGYYKIAEAKDTLTPQRLLDNLFPTTPNPDYSRHPRGGAK